MSLFSYPSHYRLLKSIQYKKVLTEGHRVTTRTLKAFVLLNTLQHPRLGLIVAKRNIAKANRRNYFKRLNKESFRLNQHALSPFDIVIMSSGVAKGAGKAQLSDEVAALWKKLLSVKQPTKINS